MDRDKLHSELVFKAIKSSGSGGQHVNKVATKIVLFFDLANSEALSEEEKRKLIVNLKSRLTKTNKIRLQCDETRSQARNKVIAIKRLFNLLETYLIEKKKRIPTKIPRRVSQKRLEQKQKQSQKKTGRKKPSLE